MARKAVHEVVLAAMGLIRDDDDVAPVGEHLIPAFDGLGLAAVEQDALLDLRQEFLDGRKDNAARRHLEQSFQMLPALGLHGSLPEQIFTAGESLEELIIEIVAVGKDDQRRIVEGEDEFAGVEYHAQAL